MMKAHFYEKGRVNMAALKVNKVENPIYETMDKIMDKYWNNWLIMGDRTFDPIGGKVYYYCKNRTNELEHTLDMLDGDITNLLFVKWYLILVQL